MANNFGNTQDLVVVDDIKKGAVILKDGSLRQIVMVGGTNFSLKSESEQNVITQAYQDFLNALNFDIQVLIHSRKINIDNYLATLESRKSGEPSPLLQNQIGEYQEFIKGFVSENAIMEKTFFVVVPFTPVSLPTKSNILGFLPFMKKSGEQEQKAAEEKTLGLEESIGQLKQRTSQVTEGLSAIGLEAVVLGDQELMELFYNLYNPESIEKKGAVTPHS